MRERRLSENLTKYQESGLYIEKIENMSFQPGQRREGQWKTHSFFLVISGDVKIAANNQVYRVGNGEGILFCPGDRVRGGTDHPDGAQGIRISFGGRIAGEVVEYLGMYSFFTFPFGAAAVTSALDGIMTCFAGGEYFRSTIQLQTMMLSIMESRDRHTRETELQGIYEYMTEHYQEPMDLATLASMYGTSVSYFTRRFRESYGQTPIQFLNHIRITNARLLLQTTQLKVREIARDCGFEKAEYFCYVFKKQEGCTPSQFRINRRHMT